jgi:iron(II)-dependent oxidoreductase
MPPRVHEIATGRSGQTLVTEHARELLAEARRRTLALVAKVSDDDLNRVHDPLMSPLVWDLGHIAAFEDLWLGQRTGGLPPLRPDLATVYDASESPRAHRGALPYLRRDEALQFMADTRARTLEVLDRDGRLGPVWEMVVQHEHQHNETMLQTLQLAEAGVCSPERAAQPPPRASRGTVRVDAGPFPLGDPGEGFAYDNERPQHVVERPNTSPSSRTAATTARSYGRRPAGVGGMPRAWSARSTGLPTVAFGPSTVSSRWTPICR